MALNVKFFLKKTILQKLVTTYLKAPERLLKLIWTLLISMIMELKASFLREILPFYLRISIHYFCAIDFWHSPCHPSIPSGTHSNYRGSCVFVDPAKKFPFMFTEDKWEIKPHYCSEGPRQGSYAVFLGCLYNLIFYQKYLSSMFIREISGDLHPTYGKWEPTLNLVYT